jgi:hypothetical protein
MCKTCKCVWIVIILSVSAYLLYDWYDGRFCDNLAVPTLCSK